MWQRSKLMLLFGEAKREAVMVVVKMAGSME